VVPGGFSSLPTVRDLQTLRKQLEAALPDMEATLETIKAIAPAIPAFDRPTEYMAVARSKEYGLFDGYIETVLPDGDRSVYGVSDYRKCTNEYIVPQSTAKYTKNRLNSYAVGALARFNVNYDKLCPEAKATADALGMHPLCTNPYYNTVAQVVECVHSVYEGMRILDELIADGVQQEQLATPTMFDRGASATEVPRGILFHEYVYDEQGMCVKGNCVIPTNQNHANIQDDFNALVPQLLEQNKNEDEIRLALEMLVRAYDPCISCSTH
jgi:coenzyme F420-reducing hydrogenase alpha subunit